VAKANLQFHTTLLIDQDVKYEKQL